MKEGGKEGYIKAGESKVRVELQDTNNTLVKARGGSQVEGGTGGSSVMLSAIEKKKNTFLKKTKEIMCSLGVVTL